MPLCHFDLTPLRLLYYPVYFILLSSCSVLFTQYLQDTLGDFIQTLYEGEDDCEVCMTIRYKAFPLDRDPKSLKTEAWQMGPQIGDNEIQDLCQKRVPN